MDRHLPSPILLQPVSPATPLTSSQTYTQLLNFIPTLQPGASRTQIERLIDSLGVEIGLVAPDESSRREEQRRLDKARRKAERRAAREEEERLEGEQGLEDVMADLEGEEGGVDAEEVGDEVEEGAVGFEGEEEMGDRGDVEYGDVVEEDEDEPDNEDEGQEKMDVDVDEAGKDNY